MCIRDRWIALALLVVAGAALVILYTLGGPGRRGASTAGTQQPTLTQATLSEGVEQFPAWSPDGKSLAYAGEAGSVRKIFIKRFGQDEGVALTNGDNDDIQPDWSPDGRSVS